MEPYGSPEPGVAFEAALLSRKLRDQATTNLKQVTTSKANLEAEILVRKRAESPLQEVNEELQVATEELRLQNDELRQAHSALAESDQRLSFVLEACHMSIWEMVIVPGMNGSKGACLRSGTSA